MRRKATAQWNGNLKEGKGSLTTDSTALRSEER
ncbi:MAG TPA: OsmC family peroxiredoxin, partial [Sphingobacterium sp.]|nr:OsmC family peroxiredoxin [Sphingobacterium sp.]